jgi:hypothetical protein
MQQLVARTLRYLATRYLADPHRSSLNTARTNAAEAHATLRERLREQAHVDAYLRARLSEYRGADETTSQRGGSVEHAG